MMLRPIASASFGAFLGIAAVTNSLFKIFQDVSGGPSIVFGTDTLVNWALVLAGAGLIWRAARLVHKIEMGQKEAMHSIRSTAQKATNNAYLLDKHVTEMDKRLATWEPFLIRLQVKESMAEERKRRRAGEEDCD